jgi:2-polyprenyl-3-methyl-5-hydroxy-6-metoxy-1,4-benzoquinol methylase
MRVSLCNACRSSRNRRLFVEQGFEVVRCEECGLAYVANPPSEEVLREIYVEAYFRGRPDSVSTVDCVKDREPFIKMGLERADYVRRIAQREKTSGRILDVGCGVGYFLAAMKDLGWDGLGVEVSEYAANLGRSELGLNVVRGDIRSVPQGLERSFDVVTLWDVMEHVPDPADLIRACEKLVKADGFLFLSTTNGDSAWFRLFGRHARIVIPPSHLYYFSRGSIDRLARDVGMQIVDYGLERLFVSPERLVRRLEKRFAFIQKASLAEKFPMLKSGCFVCPGDAIRVAACHRTGSRADGSIGD